MLRERRLSQRATLEILFACAIQNRQIHRERNQTSGHEGLGAEWGRAWGVNANGYMASSLRRKMH